MTSWGRSRRELIPDADPGSGVAKMSHFPKMWAPTTRSYHRDPIATFTRILSSLPQVTNIERIVIHQTLKILCVPILSDHVIE